MKFITLTILFSVNLVLVLCGGDPTPSQAICNGSDSLFAGQCLKPGDKKTSCNGIWIIVITDDAIIIIYVPTKQQRIIYEIDFGKKITAVCVNENGNLVVADDKGEIVKELVQDKPGGNARITEDGRLVLEADGKINWPNLNQRGSA